MMILSALGILGLLGLIFGILILIFPKRVTHLVGVFLILFGVIVLATFLAPGRT